MQNNAIILDLSKLDDKLIKNDIKETDPVLKSYQQSNPESESGAESGFIRLALRPLAGQRSPAIRPGAQAFIISKRSW
jgi:hypothetical protein